MYISRQASHILIGLGTLLGFIACFLPWSGNEIATLSGFNGEMGNPGIWIIVLIALRGVLHFLAFDLAKRIQIVVSVFLLLVVLNHLKTAFRLEMASPQLGLFLLLLSSVVLLLLALTRVR